MYPYRRIIYIRLYSMYRKFRSYTCLDSDLALEQGSLLGVSEGHGAALHLEGNYPVTLTG